MGTETIANMIAQARQDIEHLTPETVRAEVAAGDVVLVDIREPGEWSNGMIAGAITAPRGMLEFYADATSPYHRSEFESDKRVILYCASGGRSALAGSALKRLGFERVAHLDGGLNAWNAAGLPIDVSQRSR